MKDLNGFTLIELLISITILSFISLGLYQITTQSFQIQNSLEKEGDFYNSLRVALDLLGRDISHIYSPQAAALPGNIGKSQAPEIDNAGGMIPYVPLGTALPFWGEPINKTGVRPSRFNGEDNKLSFITNNHVRLYKDEATCVFTKIQYAFEEDRLLASEMTRLGYKSAKGLIKHENTDAFSEKEDSEKDTRYILLPNIKSMKIRYLDGEKDTWFNRWDTASMDHKNVFPTVIEVTLEVFFTHSENFFTVIQRFKPELPL